MDVPELSSGSQRRRERNGVVECPENRGKGTKLRARAASCLQTQRLMGILAALSTVEEVRLNVVTNSEQRAARCIRGCVLAVGACNTLGDGTC